MNDTERYRHDQSVYERPVSPYTCGRGACWEKPCWQGPGIDGSCGGTQACQPVRKGDRWECRRPKHAGGRCSSGPLPNGQCAHQQLPCSPRPRIRRWRGRLSLVAAALSLSLIVLFTHLLGKSGAGVAAIDPGPLSSAHAGFTKDDGCTACHKKHLGNSGKWISAAFTNSDVSDSCTNCHSFDGPALSAHNNKQGGSGTGHEALSCSTCHSEHKGIQADLTAVPNYVCANCHKQRFTDFASQHPAFGKTYPSTEPGSIYFDHAKHLGEYFSAEEWTGKANRDAKFALKASKSCTVCHTVETATREVKPRSYKEICARCHQHQVRDADLVLFSADGLTPFSSVLFGLNQDDADDDVVSERWTELLAAIDVDGVDALVKLADESIGIKGAGKTLFSGLSPELVRRAATAWEADEDVEQATATLVSVRGWIAGEDADGNQALFYRNAGHGDRVLVSWVRVLQRVIEGKDKERKALATAALEQILDSETGPGVCGKCHGGGLLSAKGETPQPPVWGYIDRAKNPHTRYSHAPHLNLVDADSGCKTCHKLNKSADYPAYYTSVDHQVADFMSNFTAIEKQTCVNCHRQGVVQSECQLCHTYHRSPGFKLGFKQQGPLHDQAKD